METLGAEQVATVGDRQSGDIVHADNALKVADLDAIINFGCHEFLRNLIGIGEVNRIVNALARIPRRRRVKVVKIQACVIPGGI